MFDLIHSYYTIMLPIIDFYENHFGLIIAVIYSVLLPLHLLKHTDTPILDSMVACTLISLMLTVTVFAVGMVFPFLLILGLLYICVKLFWRR